MNIETISKICNEEPNPLVFEVDLSIFISRALKSGSISVYEALLIADIDASLLRFGYTKYAYQYQFGISNLLRLLMLYATSSAFGLHEMARKYRLWVAEGLKIFGEKREHYCLKAAEYLIRGDEDAFYRCLLAERLSGKPFDCGPFHFEFFPYEYIEPERVMLEKAELQKTDCSESIVTLMQLIEEKYFG